MTTAEQQTVVLTDEYVKGPLARCVTGAFFDHERKAWVLDDPTPRGAAMALKMFPLLGNKYPWLVDLRDSLHQDVRPFDNATPYGKRIDAPRLAEALDAEGKALFEFQAVDLGYVHDILGVHGGTYIGWERGLGKTVGTLALLDSLSCTRSLIVCPNTAKQSVWGDEIERFAPWLTPVVLGNSQAQRAKALNRVAQLTQEGVPFVFIVHYEALTIIAGKQRKSAKSVDIKSGWNKLGTWDIVVGDEIHRIKDAKSQMSRALKRIPTRMKVGLSGSIIQNHAEEMYSPLQWLFPKNYKSKWRDWNDRYLDYIEGPFGKLCVGVKIERIEDLRKELGVFMVYRRKEDELDLPPKTHETRLVPLSPGQRKVYDELVADCMARLEDGTLVAAEEGLVMLGRLRQVATGLDLLGEVQDSSKLDLAVDLILDSDEAFVVFGWYKASLRALAERLERHKVTAFRVDGEVPHETRSEYIERFQGGEGRVFMGTLSTLSESVTLHRASNAIFLDRSWNPAQNIQAEDRIYRIGQERPVTITHLVAENTVDELRVLPTLANKEALRRTILGGP